MWCPSVWFDLGLDLYVSTWVKLALVLNTWLNPTGQEHREAKTPVLVEVKSSPLPEARVDRARALGPRLSDL